MPRPSSNRPPSEPLSPELPIESDEHLAIDYGDQTPEEYFEDLARRLAERRRRPRYSRFNFEPAEDVFADPNYWINL